MDLKIFAEGWVTVVLPESLPPTIIMALPFSLPKVSVSNKVEVKLILLMIVCWLCAGVCQGKGLHPDSACGVCLCVCVCGYV